MSCESNSHPNSILRLTHVCRQWRAIILNYPLFWSCPDFSRPLLAKEMIQRSKPGPLDLHLAFVIKWRTSISNMLSVMTASSNEIPRIRTLKLMLGYSGFCIPHYMLQPLVSLLTQVQRMPLLESLSIRSCGNEAKLELPTHIVAGGSPLLKELDLRQCRIPWGSPIFANLTTLNLDLSGDEFPGNDLPDGSTFLQTLGESPLLERLSLTGVFPLSITTDALPAVIVLPHLRRLHLGVQDPAQTRSCIETFRRLSFPQTVGVWLHITYDESALPFLEESSSNLFRPFFDKVTSLGKARIVRLYSESDETVNLEIWFKAIPFDPEDDFLEPLVSECYRTGEKIPSFGAEIEWLGDTQHYVPMQSVIREMARSLSMKHLETLDLRQHADEDSAKIILDALVDSTTLRCLLISEESTRGFVACITVSAFPALCDLGLFRVDLRQLIREGLFEPLVSTLETRPKKLERLMIDEHELLPIDSEIERLQNVAVVTVFNKNAR
ncbi:hypothetical protein VNI00_018179 [Paramarasmius palmivorus]|uniref:F-box domain-containing protein n=1 Tax=Paramarasmius palmivorus TaxID=297713 RepID=A0AAW0B3R5_9AGAR